MKPVLAGEAKTADFKWTWGLILTVCTLKLLFERNYFTPDMFDLDIWKLKLLFLKKLLKTCLICTSATFKGTSLLKTCFVQQVKQSK